MYWPVLPIFLREACLLWSWVTFNQIKRINLSDKLGKLKVIQYNDVRCETRLSWILKSKIVQFLGSFFFLLLGSKFPDSTLLFECLLFLVSKVLLSFNAPVYDLQSACFWMPYMFNYWYFVGKVVYYTFSEYVYLSLSA